jgi:hypothetical protein
MMTLEKILVKKIKMLMMTMMMNSLGVKGRVVKLVIIRVIKIFRKKSAQSIKKTKTMILRLNFLMER